MAVQTNREHCYGVAKLAEKFANEFGYGSVGYAIGLLHDKGKEKIDFQKYIKCKNRYDVSQVTRGNKDHAYVGAIMAKNLYGCLYPFLSYAIAGHHTGLADWKNLEEILKKDIPKEISEAKAQTISISNKERPTKGEFHHIIRMLFSSLVDADYLDTERFMNPEKFIARKQDTTLDMLIGKLNDHLQELNSTASPTEVNNIRQKIQNECKKASTNEPGFYSLTVPTGGGKTLSSMVWALNHAIRYGKKRIIIAIPYTSIIVQTAQVLKRIFGEDNVLEHHSNIDIDDSETDVNKQKKLATENWDYPIIVTTNVQLFESMYSNKPSQCRKLHNICNSVLILDEVQTLPTERLQPIVDALKTYQHLFGVSVLFTTASMPVLEGSHRGSYSHATLKGIDCIHEIVPTSFNLHNQLRRVNLHFDIELSNYDEIAERMRQYDRVLCVVNTRRDAFEIYNRLPDEGLTIHLSKMMCPIHLSKTIEMMKNALLSNDEPIIRVVSTQLIEAGVDIDFPIVFRQEAGLDSILQAAGRCNREGKQRRGDAFVFSLEKERPLKGHILATVNACKGLRIDEKTDCFAPDTMQRYFDQLYCRTQNFDKDNIQSLLCKPGKTISEFRFRTAAERFHLIEENGVSVIVNYGDSSKFKSQLEKERPHYKLMKKLAQYSVNIHKCDFETLNKGGLIEKILDGIYWIPDRAQYNDKTGLTTENHWLEEILMI